MATKPITRPTDPWGRRIEINARLEARRRPPPDPNAWNAFLCNRCEQPFRVKGFWATCAGCTSAAEKNGVAPILGAVSGS